MQKFHLATHIFLIKYKNTHMKLNFLKSGDIKGYRWKWIKYLGLPTLILESSLKFKISSAQEITLTT